MCCCGREKSVILDLKRPDDVEAIKNLARDANGLIEGFRPGVMERLGLSPQSTAGRQSQAGDRLETGWGQQGPLTSRAGHDINYITISGVLGLVVLAFGMMAALLAVRGGMPGQAVDAAMTDGSALLAAMMWSFRSAGTWREQRGTNLLDDGAPFYATYRTADGGFMAVGAIEPQFWALVRHCLGLGDDPLFNRQHDRALWPVQSARLAELFASRTRQAWCDLLDDGDTCVCPVLTMTGAAEHPRKGARNLPVGFRHSAAGAGPAIISHPMRKPQCQSARKRGPLSASKKDPSFRVDGSDAGVLLNESCG